MLQVSSDVNVLDNESNNVAVHNVAMHFETLTIPLEASPLAPEAPPADPEVPVEEPVDDPAPAPAPGREPSPFAPPDWAEPGEEPLPKA